jgi:hypothetical protein
LVDRSADEVLSTLAERSIECGPSFLFLSWAMMALRLEAELFLRLDSKYVPLDLTELEEGLGGLMDVMVLTVEEMGMRGGGMLSCFAW